MPLIRSGQIAGFDRPKTIDAAAFIAGNEIAHLALEPDADLSILAPRIGDVRTIEVAFPAYADGRGFSLARQIRRMGFSGELIAAGPLIPDQYVYALQCGFDAVLVDDTVFQKQGIDDWRAAMDAFELTYQRGYALTSGPAQSVFEARRAARSSDVAAGYDGLSAEAALRKAIEIDFAGSIALSSSMGVDSAVMLHLVSKTAPDLPILFLETQKHFTETLNYRDQLISRFGLTNVQSITPDANELIAEDPADILYKESKDACCDLRKVRPLARVVKKYKARITGRKRYQTQNRAHMPILEPGADGGQAVLNPLAHWSAKDVTGYIRKHDLPPHPLFSKGFRSVGCAPCTTRVQDGEDPRAGRWRDSDKDECGIHFIDGKWVRTPQPPAITADYI